MTDNEIIESFRPYFKDGLLSLTDPWERNDNHILFTTTAITVMDRLGLTNYPQVTAWKYGFYKRVVNQEVEPGLYQPFPSWDVNKEGKGSVSHDETLALAAWDRTIAEDLVRYGRSHLWVFNNRKLLSDIPKQLIIRFPTLIAYLYSRAGITPLIPFWHLYAIAEFLIADRSDVHLIGTKDDPTSGKCRRFIMADHFYREGNVVMRWAAKKYLDFLTKYYYDVSGLYAVYFKNHPLTWVTKGMKFIRDS